MKKRPRKYTVTEGKKHPLWIFFDQYFSLFLIPIFLFAQAAIFVYKGNAQSLEGLIAGIWMFISVLTALVIGAFLLLNTFVMKWKLNWWKNIIISVVLFLVSAGVLAAIVRAGS